jgi:LacI family gluconate utilization system Gnt-I transcriptional repressor
VPRLVDVAQVAKLSPITVSRALREPDKVSEKARARVAMAIARTGYVPDLVAASLTSRRTRLVGLIVPTLTASIYAATVAGLTAELRTAGFETLIGDSGYSLEDEQKLVAAFVARRADAIVLSSVLHTAGTRTLLARARIPVVETGNLTRKPIDMVVGFSNYAAARAMMLHLVRRDHHVIGFIGADPRDNPQASDRRRAYDRVVASHGLARRESLIVTCPSELGAGAAALVQILKANSDTTAIFAASEVRATGALLECQRRGWNVPERLAIAGYNDAGLGAHLVPALTTVSAPREDIGRQAARLILARLRGERLVGRVIDVGYRVFVRESA